MKQDISVRFLSEELGFDTYEEAAQFMVNHGAQDHLKRNEKEFLLNTGAFSVFDGARELAFKRIDIKGQI